MRIWADTKPEWVVAALQLPARICSSESNRNGLEVWEVAGGDYYRLLYSDETEFVVDRQGSRIWFCWRDCFPLHYVTPYLTGPILGFVLRLRGMISLHASSIVVGGGAIALVGTNGTGKSTTAAAFALRGLSILADDIVSLRIEEPAVVTHPGHPRICLWPESVAGLFGSREALPYITESWDKRFLDLRGPSLHFHGKPAPLKAIYFLGPRNPGPDVSIAAVEGSSAMLALVENTYANYLLDSQLRAQEFKSLVRIVSLVPMRRVSPIEGMEHLPQICDAILQDVDSLPAPRS